MDKKILIATVSIVAVICIVAAALLLLPNNDKEQPAELKYFDPLQPTEIEYTVDGKKYIVYTSMSHDLANKINVPFYYSDGYFAGDSHTYNYHMASASSIMAFTGFMKGNDVNYAVAKDCLLMLGCKNIKANKYYEEEPTADSMGVIFGTKTINQDGKEKKIVIVIPRSVDYESEWESNLLVGTGDGESKGFSSAAKIAYDDLVKYMSDNKIDGKSDDTLFWIVGYSRGAAVTNILSKNIIDSFDNDGNRMFCYTFEAPKGGVMSELRSECDYTSIHNVYDKRDFITTFAPAAMGFIHYGVDHFNTAEAGEVKEITVGTYKGAPVIQLYDNYDGINYSGNARQAQYEKLLAKYFELEDHQPMYLTIFKDLEVETIKEVNAGLYCGSFVQLLFDWSDIDREKYAGGTGINFEKLAIKIIHEKDNIELPSVGTLYCIYLSISDILASDPTMQGEELAAYLASIKEAYIDVDTIAEEVNLPVEYVDFLTDFLLNLLYKDYVYTLETYGEKGVSILPTLLVSLNQIIEFHNPTAYVMSKLFAYDSFYQ